MPPQAKRRRRRLKPAPSLIKNYGLMWRRDRVFWGKGGKKGILQGRRSGRRIDFRDQVGIYVLYDESRQPIYVGQAGRGNARLFNRLRSHTRDHLAHRWQYFCWFGLLAVNKNGSLSGWDDPKKRVHSTLGRALNEIEGVLIAATEPAFNRQGARFGDAHRYSQIADPTAEYVSNRQVADLVAKVRKSVEDKVLSRLDRMAAQIKKVRRK